MAAENPVVHSIHEQYETNPTIIKKTMEIYLGTMSINIDSALTLRRHCFARSLGIWSERRPIHPDFPHDHLLNR